MSDMENKKVEALDEELLDEVTGGLSSPEFLADRFNNGIDLEKYGFTVSTSLGTADAVYATADYDRDGYDNQ